MYKVFRTSGITSMVIHFDVFGKQLGSSISPLLEQLGLSAFRISTRPYTPRSPCQQKTHELQLLAFKAVKVSHIF
jgi:hypothetical protein